MSLVEFNRRFALAWPWLVRYAAARYRHAGIPGAREEAENTAQDTWCRGHPYYATTPEDPEAVFNGFVFTICHNLCLDRINRWHGGVVGLLGDGVGLVGDGPSGPGPIPATEYTEAQDALVKCLREMPPDEFCAIVAYIGSLGHGPAAAKQLSWDVNRFYRRLNAGKLRLRVVLLEYFDELPIGDLLWQLVLMLGSALSTIAGERGLP